MSDGKRLRRRRRRMLALDPRCHWCLRAVREYDMPQPRDWPPDMATLDHLNSLVAHPGGRPKPRLFIAGRGYVTYRYTPTTVLSCFRCNQARAADEARGLPPWTPGCRSAFARGG